MERVRHLFGDSLFGAGRFLADQLRPNIRIVFHSRSIKLEESIAEEEDKEDSDCDGGKFTKYQF